MPLFGCVGCSNNSIHTVTKIADYIFETPKYETLDYDFADKYFMENYNNWGGGCSAVSKVIDGHMLIGRNMDLNISNKCAYVVRTKGNDKGELDTIGLAYTFRDVSPDYSKVCNDQGIEDEWYKLLPFMCDDVLNSAGLHIEINMRHAEFWPNGDDKFSCEYTTENKQARKVYMFEVPRYVGSNCKTVDDAIKYIKNSINIYNKKGYWNYAYIISDCSGKSCLVEVAQNNIFITNPNNDNAVIQTNHYRYPDLNYIEDTQTGLGRYSFLEHNIVNVTNKKQLYDLMEYINYFQYYSNNCKFDRRSEIIGEYGFLTKEFVYDELKQQDVEKIFNELYGEVSKKSREQLRNDNKYWETTFTEVVDCNEKTINVKIFEKIQENDPDPIKLEITFEGTNFWSGF